MYSTHADRQRSPESFHLRDKVAYLVVCHYHVGACTCQVVHDNLFQGSDAMAVLEEVIKTWANELHASKNSCTSTSCQQSGSWVGNETGNRKLDINMATRVLRSSLAVIAPTFQHSEYTLWHTRSGPSCHSIHSLLLCDLLYHSCVGILWPLQSQGCSV
jgi:hypothetical protein